MSIENKKRLAELLKDGSFEIVAVKHPVGGIGVNVIGGKKKKQLTKFMQENCRDVIVEDIQGRDDITEIHVIYAEQSFNIPEFN